MLYNVWMPIYWSDWRNDTEGLSFHEEGAYLNLVRVYWNNFGPLTTDKKILYRMCGAQNGSEKRSINRILERYFWLENSEKYGEKVSVYHHNRIDKEIAKAIERVGKNQQRTAAATAARKKNCQERRLTLRSTVR